MKQVKYILLGVCFLGALSLNAQHTLEKLSKTINVDKDVTLKLNTQYTNIEIETWNRDQIQIEANLQSTKLSKEELRKALESWDLEVSGSGDLVYITSKGGHGGDWNFDFDFSGLEVLEMLKDFNIDIPEINVDIPNINIDVPEINIDLPDMKMPKMPKLPKLPDLPKGVHSVNFDIEAYREGGEAYLEKWSQEYEDKYGKEYKEKMKAWGKKFAETDFDKYSKEMEIWGEKWGEEYGKKMEAWGERFGKKMEAWGEAFGKEFEEKNGKKFEKWGEEYGKKMEEWGKKLEEEMEERYGDDWEEEMEKRSEKLEARIEKQAEALEARIMEREDRNTKVKKTLKIKMPKDTKLKVDVRHGELKFATAVYNLRANLAHANFLAEVIDGSNTSISASYTPVLVTNWNAGELNLKYVDKTLLKNVKSLMLNSNSSNITINNLHGNSIIDGSFGDLAINNISSSFNNLNIILENSDAHIKLPKTEYNLQFRGNKTKLQHPEKEGRNYVSSFSAGNSSSPKTIVVNAKYSNIFMQ